LLEVLFLRYQMALADCEWATATCSPALAARRFCLFGLENYSLINVGTDHVGKASAIVWMDKIVQDVGGDESKVPSLHRTSKRWMLTDTARLIVPHIKHPFLEGSPVSYVGRDVTSAADLIKVLMPFDGINPMDVRKSLGYTSFIRPSGISTFFLDGPEKRDFFFMALIVDEESAPADRRKWCGLSPQFDGAVVSAILLHDELATKGKVFLPPGVTRQATAFIRDVFENSKLYAAFCARVNSPQVIEVVQSEQRGLKRSKDAMANSMRESHCGCRGGS